MFVTCIFALGLEFDVLFLSTVRTSRLLGPGQHEGKDLGFLSNPKLLNTAITRAKFCLIVVGDPVALCSAGDCRVCWKTILSMCSENGTFHYRVPLTQVLSSVREEHTQTALAPRFNSSFPYPVQYNASPIPTELPFFPPQMRNIRQAVPVTPMTSPLHPQNYMYPIMHTGLSTPPPYQSQLRVPGAPYSHVLGNHSIGNVRNPYSERVPFQPTSPRKPVLPPTVPTYYSSHNPEAPYSQHVGHIHSQNRMMFQPPFPEMISSQIRSPAPSYSYNAETRNNDGTKTVRASKEVKSSLSESTSSSTPPYQSQTPATTSNSAPLSKENTSVGKLSLDELDKNARSLSHPDRDLDIKESHSDHIPTGNEESPQLSLPRNHSISPELPILSLCQTLRHNIANSLRNITESEEAVNMLIHNPLEDVAVEFKENIVAQTLLIQQQKSSLEQQKVLNRTLAKSIHLLQEESKKKNDVALISDISSSSPRFTHVYKINLDGDKEVQEWYRLRRQDPIVQDYIKSFEMLSERARTRGIEDNEAIESCDIFDSGNTDLAISLRGWVLQPQSVVYPDGNSLYEEHLGKDEASERIENGELIPCTLSVDRSSSGKSAICVVDDPLQKNILILDRQSMNRAFNTDYVAVEITHDLEHQDERKGKVMAILQERHHRQVVCRLASPESTVMIPLNNTNPKFSILQSDNHVGQTGVAVFNTHGDQIHFQHFVSDVQDKLFLVQFLKWDVSYRYPLGFVAKCFDPYSDKKKIDSLIPILSLDHGITNDFPLAVIEETETRFPETWRVPDEELQSRFRYEDAFTIDCKGAEELDDAISVRFVKYGIYSVSVHIADVSYFVNKGSLLDKTAQERATSVYLAPPSNLALTLFPKPLSQLCSLLPGKERLAVSVEFLIDSSGSILKSPVFRKSVVVSQEQLSFEEVDAFLSGLEMTPPTSPMLLPLQVLHYLSRQLWARRARAGSFQACTEASLQSDSRRIVEELMIITNKAVAEKLADFPDSHVVPFRIQQLPKYSALQSLALWAAENTVNLDGTWLTQFLTG